MTTKKTAAKKTTAASTRSPDTGSPDTGAPDTASPDTDGPPDPSEPQGGASTDTDPQPLVKLPSPTAGPKLDTRPGHPRVCKAPHCGRKIEKRGVCGYHWATRRSLADPA